MERRSPFARDFNNPEQIKELAKFEVNSQLAINSWLLLGSVIFMALALLLFFAARAVVKGDLLFGVLLERQAKPLFWFTLAIPVILSLIIAFYPVAIGRALTSFGIACLFFIVLTLVVGALTIASMQMRVPLISITLAAALLFGLLGLNDNHAIREAQKENIDHSQPRTTSSVGQGFMKWLENRKDRDRYQSEPYPVYVFTAEGGGIYAAYQTSTFLTSLQDLCPRFAHHVFAISAVSGGSVGAGIYSGLVKKIKNDDKRFDEGKGCDARDVGGFFYTDAAEDILRDDFLSPVLASFLFPDLLQRFLFFPVPFFDRARALEKSLEDSWEARTSYYRDKFPSDWVDAGNPLQEGFFSYWDSQSDVPALFINTTEVTTGRGRVIKPLQIKSTQFTSFPIPVQTAKSTSSGEMPLSSSVILSARFPWITPAGWFRNIEQPGSALGATSVKNEKVYLVDGGYVDNSGVITALRVIEEVEAAIHQMQTAPKIQINLIVLTTGGFSHPSSTVGDYFSPYETLLSTRHARGRIAIEQAEQFLNEKRATQSDAMTSPLEKMELRGFGYPLPLGWRLSPITRLLVLGENGDASKCSKKEDSNKRTLDPPDCLKAQVIEAMKK
jgi:hypothetical protein